MPDRALRPILAVEYFLRLAAWLFALSSEAFTDAVQTILQRFTNQTVLHGSADHYCIAITLAALACIAVRYIGPFAITRDLEELFFYDILVQIYGLVLFILDASYSSYFIAAITVYLLKFVRLAWWGKNLNGELLGTWPIFGPLGYFTKDRVEEVMSVKHRVGIYLAIALTVLVAFFIWWFLVRVPTVFVYFSGIIAIVTLTQRAAMDIQRRDEERIASLLDLERTKLLAEFNADAAARNADLRGAVHDLNNAIMPMAFTAHDLANCNDLASAKTIAHNMETRLRGLSTSIVDVVEMAVVGTKLKTPADAVIDLSDLASHFSREFKAMAGKRGISLGINVVQGAVKSNEWLLQRIIHNLLINAIVHGKNKTRVKLSLYCNRQFCYIRICDTGPGIAGADGSNRAANFQNVVNHLPRNKQTGPDQGHDPVHGHGLGLRSVLRMSNTLGLQIGMQSRIGVGTIYRFKVPLADQCLS